MIACLLGLKSGDVSTAGAEAVNQTLKREIDLDLDALLAVDADHLIDFLVVGKGFREENMDQLTEILLLLADDMTGDHPQRDTLYIIGVCFSATTWKRCNEPSLLIGIRSWSKSKRVSDKTVTVYGCVATSWAADEKKI